MAEHRRTAKAGLVTGLLLGLPLGAAVVWGFVARARQENETKWATVPVLVASHALSAGQELRPADLVEAAFPASLVTANCATPQTRARIEGRTLRWSVKAGAVVRETDLVQPSRACAARAEAAAKRLGLPAEDELVSTFVSRHRGSP